MTATVPRVDLRAYRPPLAATRLLTKRLCEEHTIVPVCIAHDALVVAAVKPEGRSSLVSELSLFTGMKIEVVQASEDEIVDTIRACYGVES